jgi:hypothetical protein
MITTSGSVSTLIPLSPNQKHMKKILLTIVLVTQDNNKVSIPTRLGTILQTMLSKDGQKTKKHR